MVHGILSSDYTPVYCRNKQGKLYLVGRAREYRPDIHKNEFKNNSLDILEDVKFEKFTTFLM